MINSLLNAGVAGISEIVYYVLAIVGVIMISTFAVVFVGDLLMLLIAPKRNGLIFNRANKKEKKLNKIQRKMNKLTKNNQQKQENVQEMQKEAVPYNVTVTPLSQTDLSAVGSVSESVNSFDSDVALSNIDFNKASEEQKELEMKFLNNSQKDSKVSNVSFSSEQLNKPVVVPVFEEDDSVEESEEHDVLNIIDDIKDRALAEISEEDKSKLVVERVQPVVNVEFEEEETLTNETEVLEVEIPKITKIKSPKLILKVADKKKTGELDLNVKSFNSEDIEKVVERVVERMLDEKKEVNNLRKIREDLLNLRINTFRDKKISEGIVSETRQKEILNFEESVQGKLSEIEVLKFKKQELESEKEDLIKDNEKTEQEKILLENEIDSLKNELQLLKVSAGITDKPYYTKEYYENRLEELELELKDIKKELRLVNREFNPLKRIKRTLDRDIVKLRRKEASVAKQKLRIYGVNNVKNIDPEKVEKLNAEVEILNNLKDSVHHCETVMKQNKDRYPVLERSNRHLTRHIETLNKDIERVLKAIEWYENNN